MSVLVSLLCASTRQVPHLLLLLVGRLPYMRWLLWLNAASNSCTCASLQQPTQAALLASLPLHPNFCVQLTLWRQRKVPAGELPCCIVARAAVTLPI
jgi:hypothetical protein